MGAAIERECRLGDYVFQVALDEDGEFFLTIPRLPGCVAAGGSLEEAVENLGAAFDDWTADVVASGHEVPAAATEADYSGKTLLRMPRWLHAGLAARAEQEGLSLNALAVSFLSRALGAEAQASRTESALVGLQCQVVALQTTLADMRSAQSAEASQHTLRHS